MLLEQMKLYTSLSEFDFFDITNLALSWPWPAPGSVARRIPSEEFIIGLLARSGMHCRVHDGLAAGQYVRLAERVTFTQGGEDGFQGSVHALRHPISLGVVRCCIAKGDLVFPTEVLEGL